MPPVGQRKKLRGILALPVSRRVGCLLQAAVWRFRTHHDPDLRRISAPLSTAPPAEGIPAHSLFRLARQWKTQQASSTLSQLFPEHAITTSSHCPPPNFRLSLTSLP